ncbi:hypothetical protein UMM65_02785 [Aureibaculum sp. 2210JD6-5]|uniref:hypothetical protein n=1 Tax=Aureibaculum sp. 2210JD6-5 TaxID=3103957 RepID=UPI002AAC7A88|nr:hypothetical protein [Aureibaculum sp. 2210JD6-5]MDY7394152.1 hypothetical protein [Aureibaculum sp. 2210JD6-5]
MKQFNLNNGTLTLKVKKSPLVVRSIMFVFSFLCFLLPIMGIVMAISIGSKFHIGFIIVLFLFGLIGFYLLRISLWNTYGKEVIELNEKTVNYEANYGWFKDGKKTINSDNLNYTIRPIGYEEDKKGVLIINNDDSVIESVVKIPILQLEELVKILKN